MFIFKLIWRQKAQMDNFQEMPYAFYIITTSFFAYGENMLIIIINCVLWWRFTNKNALQQVCSSMVNFKSCNLQVKFDWISLLFNSLFHSFILQIIKVKPWEQENILESICKMCILIQSKNIKNNIFPFVLLCVWYVWDYCGIFIRSL